MKNMLKKPSYELIDHTADFGIHVFGDNPKDLFQNAAMALIDQLVETADLLAREERRIAIQGNDWPDLIVNWLREILYLWVGEEIFAQSVQIKSMTENSLTAHLWVDPFSSERHTLISEIKAVTYHQVQVFETGNRWEANVIFDT
ncbi:archease [Thermodesulfobacteriota bacterium]